MSHDDVTLTSYVSEIFKDIGFAFTRLGELETILNPNNESRPENCEDEIIALKAAIAKFGGQIEKLCHIMKERTRQRLRDSIKKDAYEGAGLPLPEEQSSDDSETDIPQENVVPESMAAAYAEFPLKMINESEEVYEEGVYPKLDYEDLFG